MNVREVSHSRRRPLLGLLVVENFAKVFSSSNELSLSLIMFQPPCCKSGFMTVSLYNGCPVRQYFSILTLINIRYKYNIKQVCAGALNEKCGHRYIPLPFPLPGPKSMAQDSGPEDTCAPGLRNDFDISIIL